jgi:RimJ/RimL family protein N-acetyltransferase
VTAEQTAPVRLETARLRLRRLTADDVDHLYELDADPLVMRYINGGRETPRDEVEHEVLPRMMRWYDVRTDVGHWAGELVSTGEFVGWFGLSPVEDDPADLSLGYRLRREFWVRDWRARAAALSFGPRSTTSVRTASARRR